jgi:DNA (cytosine-5)-methyltransferase 1
MTEQSPDIARLKIGELFAGYGGLGMGVQAALGGEIAWFSEYDKGPSKILAHRFPGVPNHGDITTIDWSQVEPVDILTGGSPCQDLSHAGRRAGMTEGTRSNLWVAMREAIAQLRPGLVVWENVRGAYSAEADSALEFCAGCMGDAWYRGAALRALGRVLGDLSDLGYDARWHGLRAADVGAPHNRGRVFVVAEDTHRVGERPWAAAPVSQSRTRPEIRPSRPAGSPLLPTPTVNDMGVGKTLDWWDAWTEKMRSAHGNGNGHSNSLSIEVKRIERWDDYLPALRTWSDVLDRPWPDPLREGEINPAFMEWQMGLPAGWVTDVPDLTAAQARKALGNGVVPQQAAAAIREMFAWEVAA